MERGILQIGESAEDQTLNYRYGMPVSMTEASRRKTSQKARWTGGAEPRWAPLTARTSGVV